MGHEDTRTVGGRHVVADGIAVVGMAVCFPQAASLAEFRANLRAGRDSVRPMPPERVSSNNLDPDTDYGQLGYLDRIDLFDYRFFGLSRREAELMDPQHRFALQLAQHAVEDAGYRPSSFRESRTAVVFSSPSASYASLLTEAGTLSMIGTVPCALPSRVSHLFGLTGPCYGVDTGCNGSMVAVHHASRELRSGEADYALAGGVSLRSLHAPRSAVAAFQGIMSPESKCRAFDADADGTVGGEGGAVLLLTTLERALADRAPIYAVIRGSAVAHNGHQSATIATPSPTAQAAVIQRAWQAAGLPLNTVGYLETHGSGTQLGDAVEVEGLRLLRQERERTLPIGSVKTNIGHLDHAAGIAGMVKAILSVRYGELYPSLHFRRPPAAVDMPAAGVEVVTELRPWQVDAGQLRRAGVSSFSLGGINAHCVVEQAPPPAAPASAPDAAARLVGVSAHGRPELAAACTQLAVALRSGGPALADVAHTLNEGRDHHRHRVAVVARDTGELATQLAAQATWLRLDEPARVPEGPAGVPPRLILLLSGDAEIPPGQPAPELPAELPLTGPAAATVGWQLAAHQRLLDAGFTVDTMLSSGVSRYAVRWLRGELSASDRAELATGAGHRPADPARLRAAAAGLASDGPALLVELGVSGEIGRLLAAELVDAPEVVVHTVPARPDGLLEMIGRLYEAGLMPDWVALAPAGEMPRRVPLPGYPFRGERCWPGAAAAELAAAATEVSELSSAVPAPRMAPEVERVPLPPVAEPVAEPAAVTAAEPAVPTDAPTRTGTSADTSTDAPIDASAVADAPISAGTPTGDAVAESVGSWLRGALARLLYADDVPEAADYFALGGNSVIALQLIDQIEERYGIRLRLIDIYDHPQLPDLVAAIQDRAGLTTPVEGRATSAAPATPVAPEPTHSPLPQPPPITPGDELVLSYGQERMWFHHQIDPQTTLYNLPSPSRIRGPFDPAVLQAAWEDLAERHSVLRSNFVEEDGRPKLVIRPRLGDFFHLVDVSGEPDPLEAARRVMNREQGHVFDVANDPLVRVTVIRIAEDDHVNFTTMHHAVNDGWAPAVLLGELSQYLQARASGQEVKLPPLPIQFYDYARWQRELMSGPMLEVELSYWRQELQDPPVLQLPTDFPRPDRRDYLGAVHPFLLDADLLRDLRRLGEQEATTLFTVMLSGLYVMLSHYSHQDDIIVGTPTIGRTRPELWQLIGFFNNTIALRGDLSGDVTFRELLRRTRRVVMEGLERQEVPFDKVVKAVAPTEKDLSRSPLFDVMYIHQTLPPTVPGQFGRGTVLEEPDRVDPFPGLPAGTSKFDLSLVVGEHAGHEDMMAMLEYSTQLFTAETAARMAETFQQVLRGAVQDADLRCRQLAAPADRASAPAVTVGGEGGSDTEDGNELAHWRRIGQAAPVLQLPTDRPRSRQRDLTAGRHRFSIPTGLAGDLAELAGRTATDVSDVLLAGYAALLSLRAGQDELVIGVPATPGGLAPLRVDLADEPGLGELAVRIRDAARQAQGSGRREPAEVAAVLGASTEPGRHPFFDVAFDDRGALPVGDACPFDLVLSVPAGPGEADSAALTFRAQLFDRDTVAGLAEELVALLAAAVADPEQPLVEIWLAGPVAGHLS